MTRDELLTYIATNPDIKEMLEGVCPKKEIYYDDFCSHFFLQIFLIDYDKLLNAYNNNKLKALCYRIMKNQAYSYGSSFHKIYRNHGKAGTTPIKMLPLDNINPPDPPPEPQYDKIQLIKTLLEEKHKEDLKKDGITGHYDYILFKKYHFEKKTYQQIEKETGINFQTVRLAVKRTEKWIRDRIKRLD